MSIFKKSNNKNHVEPMLSFGESLIVLIVILCILGFLIIIQHQEPQAPLFIAFTLRLHAAGHLRQAARLQLGYGHGWHAAWFKGRC